MSFLLNDNPYFNIETMEGDSNLRVYHSSLRLLDDGYQHVEAYKGVQRLRFSDEEPEPLPSVMEFALEIDGVVWVKVTAYSLVVRKNPIFTWNSIDVKLIQLWAGIKSSLDLEDLVKLEDKRPPPDPNKSSV